MKKKQKEECCGTCKKMVTSPKMGHGCKRIVRSYGGYGTVSPSTHCKHWSKKEAKNDEE